MIETAKQIFDVGQTRNRLPPRRGTHRPLMPDLPAPAICWYTTADILTKLRRVLIAAKYHLTRPEQPTPAEIHAIRPAWDTDAA